MTKQAKIRKRRRQREARRALLRDAEAIAATMWPAKPSAEVVEFVMCGDRENEMAQANDRFAALERRAKYRNRKGRRAYRRLVEVTSGDRWMP